MSRDGNGSVDGAGKGQTGPLHEYGRQLGGVVEGLKCRVVDTKQSGCLGVRGSDAPKLFGSTNKLRSGGKVGAEACRVVKRCRALLRQRSEV